MDSSFWAMSGYAAYVWGSFGLAAAVFIWNWWSPRVRRRRIFEATLDE